MVEFLTGGGFRKINFAAGEPTLCPWLPDLILRARELRLTTPVVTNGSRLNAQRLQREVPLGSNVLPARGRVPWVHMGLSVWAGNETNGRNPQSREPEPVPVGAPESLEWWPSPG